MEDINKKLLNLWETTPSEYLNGLMPFFLDEFKREAVMFLGINPSFSVKGFGKGLQQSEYSGIDIREFYSFPKSEIFDLKKALKIENVMRDEYPYFRPFEKLLEGTGAECNHMDLFYMRVTSQDELGKLVFLKNEELNEFGEAQLRITKEVLEEISPRAIVVVNSLASRIFRREYGLQQLDEDHGCYFSLIAGRQIPIFLSSMLTGGAMDMFSKERLGWHIRKVLKELC